MNNKKQGPTKVNLLEDRPASRDAFGSHDRVAEAIAQIVTDHPNGMTIGLEGSWGSGKSTIVSSVKRILSKNKNIKVIIFDAWSHEGDPLRRSFLEEIISHLLDYKWISTKRWKKVQETLRGTTSLTTKTTTREATTAGRMLALTATLVPIGILLTGSSTSSAPMYNLGIFLLTGPAIVLLIIGLVNVYRDRVLGKSHIGILESESKERERSTTTKDPDPSSIEFREHFEQLLNDALFTDDSRKLVLVIDNTDRVDPNSAKKIWSTLRVYIDRPTIDPKSQFSRLWTIVPYDRSSLSRIARSMPEDAEEPNTSDAFMGKFFQTIFYTPPPVHFDWHRYFLDQLDVAWGPESDERSGEYHFIYRIYALAVSKTNQRVTPRDILRFINEVGSLASQWTGVIELRHFAYYVTLKRSEIAIEDGLTEGSLPASDFTPLLGQNVVEELAAIHYNVEPERATSFLFREPITRCLEEGDESRLPSIVSSHPPAELLLDDMIREYIDVRLPDETEKYFTAVNVIFNLFDQISIERASELAEILNNAMQRIDVLTGFSEHTSRGLIRLLTRFPDLLQHLESVITSSVNSSVGGKNVFEWPASLAPLLDFLTQAAVHRDELQPLPAYDVDVNVEDWLPTATQLRTLDPEKVFWDRIRPGATDQDKFYAELLKAFEPNTQNIGVFDAVVVAHQVGVSADFPGLQNQINSQLVSTAVIEPDMVAEFVATNVFLAEKGFKPQQPRAWASSGMALHHFFGCMQAKAWKSASWCMYVFLDNFPNRSGHADQHHSPQGKSQLDRVFASPKEHEPLIKEFLEIVEHQKRLDLLHKILTSSDDASDFFAHCLATLESPETLLDQEGFISIWPQLQDSVKDGKLPSEVYLKIVGHQIKDNTVIDNMLKDGFDPGDSELFIDALKANPEPSDHLLSSLGDSLIELDASDYEAGLEHHLPFFNLIQDIFNYMPNLKLGTRFCDAVHEIATAAVIGTATTILDRDKVEMLLGRLESNARQTLRDELKNIAKKSADKIHGQFFEIFGNEISVRDSLSQDEDLVLELLIPIVRTHNEAGLHWMLKIPDLKNIIDSAALNAHKETLFARIREEAGDAAEGSTAIRALASMLDIDVEADKELEQNDDNTEVKR